MCTSKPLGMPGNSHLWMGVGAMISFTYVEGVSTHSGGYSVARLGVGHLLEHGETVSRAKPEPTEGNRTALVCTSRATFNNQ